MGYIGNQSAVAIYSNINTFRGKVANLTALSAVSGMMSGDVYVTKDNNHAHMYTGTIWVDLGEIRGPQGPAGVGILSIRRTTGDGSAGTVDTYTVTYSDATTITFDVYNGKNGITWYTGTTAPDAGVGVDGDLYFNMLTNYYYRKETGVWSPKGTLRGEAFSANASGTLVGRAVYDNEITGFGYIVLDAAVPTLYFKLSDNAGDWDSGTAVGKGAGISTITKTGTVGNVDTYTITYDDFRTSTFEITNANIDDTVEALDKTWSSSKTREEIVKSKPSIAFLMAYSN